MEEHAIDPSRAGGAAATDPAVLVEALGPHASLRRLVQHAIAESVQRLVVHDPIVRAGDDAEAVHQARVATRRLRSDLRTFAPVLEARWATDLGRELQWIGTALGRVRDADVLLQELAERVPRVSAPSRLGTQVVIEQLRDDRADHHTALLDAMASPRYAALADRLVDAARHPRFRGLDDSRPRRRARALARRPWTRLRRTVRALPAEPSDAQLHEVRKRAKHTRYALEAIAPISPRRVGRLAERVSDLQDVLGAQHDAIVAAERLREAADRLDAPAAFAAGVQAGEFLRNAADLRPAWRRRWRRAQRLAADVF